MLLINVTVAVSNGAAQDVVWVTKDLDQRNGLRPDLEEEQVDGVLDEAVVALVEPAKVVASRHAFL